MKIYAESQVVEVPTYSHVGYLATKTFNPHYPILSVGIVLLLLGTIISGQFRMYKTDKKFITLIKHPTKKVKIGFIVSSIGIIVGVLAFFPFGSSTWDRPNRITQDREQFISYNIVEYRNKMLKLGKDSVLPTDIDSIIILINKEKDLELWDWRTTDAWDNPMKIKTGEYKGETIYYIMSAGEDGKYDTNDDIVYPQENGLDDYLEKLHYQLEKETVETNIDMQ